MNQAPMQCREEGPMIDPPLTARLQREKTTLEQRLKDVDHALRLLTANPNIAEALDAISKLGTRI